MRCLQPLEETETAWEDTLEESVTDTMCGASYPVPGGLLS